MCPIQPSSAFVVERRIDGSAETPRLLLRCNTAAQPVAVHGAVLEAQFEAADGYLVFTTEGTPYEEALHIYWLDRAGRTLDAVELSAPYTPAIFGSAEVHANSAVQFSFFDDGLAWRASVAEKPGMRFHRLPYPARRKLPWWRPAWISLEN